MNKNPDLTRIFNDIGRAKEETASGIVEERRKMEEERKKKLQESITGSKPREEFKDIDDLSEIEKRIDEALAAAKRGTPIFSDFEFDDDDMDADDDFIIKKPVADEGMFEFNFEDEPASEPALVVEEAIIPPVEIPAAPEIAAENDVIFDSDVMSFDLDFGDEVPMGESKEEELPVVIDEPTTATLVEEPAIEFDFDEPVEEPKEEQNYFIGTFIEEVPFEDGALSAEEENNSLSIDFETAPEIVEEKLESLAVDEETDTVEFDFDDNEESEAAAEDIIIDESEGIEEAVTEEPESVEIDEFVFDDNPVADEVIPVVEAEVVESLVDAVVLAETADIVEEPEVILEVDDDVLDIEFEDEFTEGSDTVESEVITEISDKEEKQIKTAHGYLSVKTDSDSNSVGYAYLLVCHDGSNKIFGKGSHGIDESGALFDCAAGLIDETIKAGQDELYIHAERKFYKKLALEDIPGDSEENKARFMNYIAKASECAKFVNIKITDKILGEDVLHSFKVDEIATFSAKK